MTIWILRRDDHLAMPWRNGRGESLEVLRSPAGAALDDIDWRLTFARVGGVDAFSHYPGIDRFILLVQGDRMVLTSQHADDTEPTVHDLGPFEPLSFPGEADVQGETAHGSIDFNVMTRRDSCVGDVEIQKLAAGDELPLEADPGAQQFAVVLAGRCTLLTEDDRIALDTLDAAASQLDDGPEDVQVRADEDAVLALVRIEPRH